MSNGNEKSGALVGVLIAAGLGFLLLNAASSAGSAGSAGTRPPVPVPPTPPPPPPPPPSIKVPAGSGVLLLGDSLAVGMTPKFKSLASADGYVPSSQTKTGTTIRYWKSNAPAAIAQFRPALVLVSLGTNDSVLSDPKSEDADLQALIQTIQASGALLVWIGPPTMPATTNGRPMQLDTVVQMIQPKVEFYYDSRQLTIPRAPDGIHAASGTAYANWMAEVWKWLKSQNIIQA